MAEEEKMKKNPVIETALEHIVNFPLMVEKLDEVLEELKDQTKQDEKSLRLTEEDLNKIINSLQETHRDANREKVKIQTKIVTPSEFRQQKKKFLNFLEALLVGQPERLKKMREEFNRTFTLETYENQMRAIESQIIGPLEIFGSFFELSKIFQPHAVARYPKTGFNPLELYTPDLPLVKSFPKLADITERVLNQIDDLYQKSEG